MKIFPYAVAILDIGATVVYFYNKQWLLGLTWLFYAMAAITLGSAK